MQDEERDRGYTKTEVGNCGDAKQIGRRSYNLLKNKSVTFNYIYVPNIELTKL